MGQRQVAKFTQCGSLGAVLSLAGYGYIWRLSIHPIGCIFIHMISAAKMERVLQKKGWSVRDVGRALGSDSIPNYIYRIMRGEREARKETVLKVAAALGVPPREIVDEEIEQWFAQPNSSEPELLPGDTSLKDLAKRVFELADLTGVDKFQLIPPDVRWTLAEPAASYNAGSLTTRPGLPIVGYVAAGEVSVPDYSDGDYPPGVGALGEIDPGGIPDASAYAVEVRGDSMYPLYMDRDILIVTPALTWKSRHPCLVRATDGRVWVKRVLDKAPILQLVSDNPLYEPIALTLDQVRYVHRVYMTISR